MNLIVVAACGGGEAVSGKGRGQHDIVVAVIARHLASRGGVPDMGLVRRAADAGEQTPAVWTKGEAHHLRALVDLLQHASVDQVPEFDGAVERARGDLSVPERDGKGDHLVLVTGKG